VSLTLAPDQFGGHIGNAANNNGAALGVGGFHSHLPEVSILKAVKVHGMHIVAVLENYLPHGLAFLSFAYV
jgi:hypothetical protein